MFLMDIDKFSQGFYVLLSLWKSFWIEWNFNLSFPNLKWFLNVHIFHDQKLLSDTSLPWNLHLNKQKKMLKCDYKFLWLQLRSITCMKMEQSFGQLLRNGHADFEKKEIPWKGCTNHVGA